MILLMSEIDYSQFEISSNSEHMELFIMSILWVMIGSMCIAISTGIIRKKLWSIRIAIFVSFVVSENVLGFLAACYTWSVTSSALSESDSTVSSANRRHGDS